MSTDNADTDKFEIEINDEVTLGRRSSVEHVKHGPMEVDTISVSAMGKRARLKSMMREDGLSIELTEDELREQWGERIAAHPMDLHDEGQVTYTKSFGDDDVGVEVEIEVSGEERVAEPMMASLHDQTIRVYRALQDMETPDDVDGVYDIDWESIHRDRRTERDLDEF